MAGAGTMAGHGATALGLLSSAVDAGMRMYYAEELTRLTEQIHAARAAISSWQEVQNQQEVNAKVQRYDAMRDLYAADGEAYQAALDTRRSAYQEIGRRMDQEAASHGQGAAAGGGDADHAHPTNSQDNYSQVFLFMSAVRESTSVLGAALPAATDAQASVNTAIRGLGHRREPYQTRDNAWAGTGVTEERGPDEPILYQMRDVITGWINEATAARDALADDEASAQRLMGRY
jgi:hypothetical protein